MRKSFLILISLVILLAGCSDDVYNNDTLSFALDGDDYKVVDSVVYDELVLEIEQYMVDDVKVASLSTSTSNILAALGVELAASTDSKDLNPELKAELESGDVTNLGSALEPNMEQLLLSDVDLIFVASTMPHKDKYEALDNVVYLPLDTYEDLFYTIAALVNQFGVGQVKLNELALVDQAAKELIDDRYDDVDVLALTYAYEHFKFAASDSFVNSILSQLGITNMSNGSVDLAISYEALLSLDPDVLVIYGKGDTMMDELKSLESDGYFDNLKAYQNDEVYIYQVQSLNANIDSPDVLLSLSEDLYGA